MTVNKLKVDYKYLIVLLLLLITVSCGSVTEKLIGGEQHTINFAELWGTWKAIKINEKPIAETNIEYIRLNLYQNGSLTYEIKEKGTDHVNGKGYWSLADNNLVYTIAENKSKTQIVLLNNLLSLNPDPIVLKTDNLTATVIYTK